MNSWKWELYHSEGVTVPEHSLIGPEGVLCRYWGEEHPKHADLISAAPLMYAALIAVRKELQLSGNWDAKDYGWPANRKAINVAIAKAEGEGDAD